MTKSDKSVQSNNIRLVLDTSTAMMAIALMDGSQLIAEYNQLVHRTHSTELLPAIERLLAEHGISITQLSAIVVGQGPGSYTGVRIGVTAAKTLAWTLQLPLIGISSIAAMAHRIARELDVEQSAWIVPLFDARRERVYTGVYSEENESVFSDRIAALPEWVVLLHDAAAELAIERRPERVIFAVDSQQLKEKLQSLTQDWTGPVEVVVQTIRAFDAGLAAARHEHAEKQSAIHPFVPNYTQLAEAETKLRANRK